MIRRGVPGTIDYPHVGQFFESQASPVGRRTIGFDTTAALAAELVQEGLIPSILTLSQHMWTEQPNAAVVDGGDWAPFQNCLLHDLKLLV